MENNLTIKTVHICRTCTKEIINTSFFHLDFTQVDNEPRIGQKLSNCVPELDLSIVPNTVICSKCADTINSLYIFKEECLQLEMQICEYIQQVQHTGNVLDLAAVVQLHQLRSKNLSTAELQTEALEKTENYKNEESQTSFCENYVFNETEGNTEVANREYLTSLQTVERHCVLFNTFDNFINSDKSEEEEDNSDTHDDSNVVQDCFLKVVENPDSYIQNLNKSNIYYQCFTCGHKAESKLKLIRHLKGHTNNKFYQNKISSESRKSLRHLYKCDLCNYSTKHKCLFSFHNRAHLTKKNYQRILKCSPILAKPSTNTITFGKKNNKDIKIIRGIRSSKKHINITVKPFKCWLSEICDFSSNNKHNLKIHMLTRTDTNTFKCSVCEYCCKQKNSLNKIHMLTHTNTNTFKCSVCEYCCKQKNSLKIHMLTHTDEKPFKCLVCGYYGKQKSNLKTHMLTHTHEKPFKCSDCEYSCNQRRTLKIHMRKHIKISC